MSPLVTYKGWTVSKQSANKVAATELALWLSSKDVQKEFAVETYTMPTHVALESDMDINDDAVLAGFLEQTKRVHQLRQREQCPLFTILCPPPLSKHTQASHRQMKHFPVQTSNLRNRLNPYPERSVSACRRVSDNNNRI